MWPSIWRLAPDVQSSKLLDLAAIETIVVAVNRNSGLSHRCQGPCKKSKNHLVCISLVFITLIGTLFICHQWGSLENMGKLPTQEKVVTYLLEPQIWQFKERS